MRNQHFAWFNHFPQIKFTNNRTLSGSFQIQVKLMKSTNGVNNVATKFDRECMNEHGTSINQPNLD